MNEDSDKPVAPGSSASESLEQGRAYRASGQLDLAYQSFQTALSIDSASAQAALGLGQCCYDLGRSSEALHYLEQAVQADPLNAEALCYCAQALADAGHMDLSLQFFSQAIEAAPENLNYKLAAIAVLQGIEFTAEHAWYEQFLIDCFDDPRLIHDAITNVATSLLWVKPAMQKALAADRLDTTHFVGLEQEPLLLRLLTKTIARSWAFEAFFARLRLSLAQMSDSAFLPLMAGVAEQAFNSGYVQYQSDEEVTLEKDLLQKDATSLTPVELMTLASYRALVDVPGAEEVAARSDFPESIQRVIQRTLLEPLHEREIQSKIVSLTPIEDGVSQRVQAQYEEAPYPRLVNIQSVNQRNERLVDEIAQQALNFEDTGWPERPRVLVPGCGTGYHPLSLARQYPETDVLAVDLSRTSLAYAIRKQQELGFTNVRFCQADLLHLGELSDRFEYIDCAGVLHHLDSPLEGWRVLSELLQPGGVMRVGLYSKLARKTIVAAREVIAAKRIPSTAAAIRQFRHQIMNDPELTELQNLAKTTADFFSMGGIRDLIFHVQEHRFDVPMIRQSLDALGLEFGGFLLSDRDIVREFHARYPARSQWLDLECWAEFELQHPNMFYSMYQFYCLKPNPETALPTS